MKKAVIFDMDGVLVVNMHFHELAFYELGKRYGKNIDRDFFLTQICGSTNERIMPKIFGQIDAERISQLSQEKEQIYRELYKPELQLSPGLPAFLELLKGLNIPMAIASNAPPENIDFISAAFGLDRYISVFLNAYSVPNPKPAPDMFLKAAEIFGSDPAGCVVFEDAPGGIRAAYAAGMKAVCMLTTHGRHEFEKADLFLKDFTDPALTLFIETNLKA